MTTRDIADTLQELYGTEVSPALVARSPTRSGTPCKPGKAARWKRSTRSCIWMVWIKVHQDNRVINKTMHVALGVNLAGHRKSWACWLAETEGCQVLAVGVDGTAKSRAEGRVRHLRGRFDRLSRSHSDGLSARPGTTYRASGAQHLALRRRQGLSAVVADMKRIYPAATSPKPNGR